MWWYGPSWLRLDESEWPVLSLKPSELPEMRVISSHVATNASSSGFPFSKFSSLNRLNRVTAYVFRFVNNLKGGRQDQDAYLTSPELASSFLKLIKSAQLESFREEIKFVTAQKPLNLNSKILCLHPFLDEKGILRVGSRLTNSEYPYDKKYPILLSPTHDVTRLIFESEHAKIARRSKKVFRNCVKCARYRPALVQPIMWDLPKARLLPTTPFTVVGVDYVGPFIMKDRRGRGRKDLKCWVALFVCFSSRAIHLELVLSLSADDLIRAFHRFVSRRGKQVEVFSDNGTNFVKANKDLKELGVFLSQNQNIMGESFENLGIKWRFFPTNSPHFGGLWEAGVKSMKHHMRRVLGTTSIFFLISKLC